MCWCPKLDKYQVCRGRDGKKRFANVDCNGLMWGGSGSPNNSSYLFTQTRHFFRNRVFLYAFLTLFGKRRVWVLPHPYVIPKGKQEPSEQAISTEVCNEDEQSFSPPPPLPLLDRANIGENSFWLRAWQTLDLKLGFAHAREISSVKVQIISFCQVDSYQVLARGGKIPN